MSSFKTEKFTCPKCQQENPITVWNSVNVDLDPEMKEKVMDGSIFSWTCPNCGETFSVLYPLLYHDMTHNIMVWFDPNNTSLIPFCEYIHIKENELDENIIHKLAEEYRAGHPKENILFDAVEDDKLIFTVYVMPDKYWESTDRKWEIAIEEYNKKL